MADSFKHAYRKGRKSMSTSSKVIIIMLAVLAVTVLAFLIKITASKIFDPAIVYPPESSETNAVSDITDTPVQTTASEDTDTGIDVRAVDSVGFDTKTGSLVLVNKNIPYSLSDTQQLVDLSVEPHENFAVETNSERLLKDAYDALCRMCDDFAGRSGFCPVVVTSAYRDEESQKVFYNNYVVNESDKAYVELPGYSDHHTGLGFDVKLRDKDGNSFSYGRYATERAPWLVENFKNYGFIIRYPARKSAFTGIDGESNHFRYVGLPHSVYITDNGICLEEYLSLVKNYSYDSPLHIMADSDEYIVWYCEKENLYVPADKDYTVSGDNNGGFIVTVKNDIE